VAVIIGAGPGVGTATARRLAREGYDLGLVARDESRLAGTAKALEAEGAAVGYAVADTTDADALTRALTAMGDHTGRIDVLLFNPSRWRQATARELTAADLLDDLAIGTAGLLTTVRAVLPRMLEQHTGTILVTGGGAADAAMREGASLAVQKAALRALVRALARDLAPEGIHVATVTVRGTIAEGTPFAPDTIADAYAGLVAETASDPAGWRTVVDLTKDGLRTAS